MKRKVILLIVASAMINIYAKAQIGIGTTNPHKSSILDVESNTKGFLPPRVATDTDITDPAEGLMIYDESDNCLNVYNNSVWVDLCSNTGGSSPSNPSSSSPNIASDCNGVFQNISTFGKNAYYKQFSGSQSSTTYYPFHFHLNTDGSKLYHNRGGYYDTNSTYWSGFVNNEGFTATTQVLALSQAMPGKKWVDFIEIDYSINHYPVMLYLLSDSGELYNFPILEIRSGGTPQNYDQLSVTTSLIDPGNDNKYLNDPGTGNNDYRFTPYPLIVNDTDNSIKFSSLHYSTADKNDYAILPYDNIGKKFYSLGYEDASRTKSKATKERLHRTVTTTTLKESITLREADFLNKVITHFNTEFEEGSGDDITFSSNNSHTVFITKDGFVNMLDGNKIFRINLPTGVKAKSIIGNHTTGSPILGSDGKVYKLPSYTSTSLTNNFNSSGSISITGVPYNVIIYTVKNPIELYFNASTHSSFYATANNHNIKQLVVSSLVSNSIVYLTTDNKLYYASNLHSATHVDFIDLTTQYNLPIINRILASDRDIILEDENGITFGFTLNNIDKLDLPEAAIGDMAIGYDGLPVTDYLNNRIRLFYSCYGN